MLFVYAREHPSVEYKQGMHELLAPLVFVIHCDQQSLIHARETGLLSHQSPQDVAKQIDKSTSQDSAHKSRMFGHQSELELLEWLDVTYLEHDAFALFELLMEMVEQWYSNQELSSSMDIHLPSTTQEPFSQCSSQSSATNSVLGVKLRMIFEQIVRRHDAPLYTHLLELQIEPQLFGIRWLRLLFGREFSLQDLLVLWDAIFADGISLCLVDYVRF